MNGDLRVIGVDPGPIPGIVRLHIRNGVIIERWTHAVQCTANVAPEIVGAFLSVSTEEWPSTVLAVEKFVVGRASMRSGADGAITRDLVGHLQALAAQQGASYVERSAGQVKPWATELRLAGAGLLEPTKAMRHARDAARHALFAAVNSGAITDPLSKTQTTRSTA